MKANVRYACLKIMREGNFAEFNSDFLIDKCCKMKNPFFSAN
jgi:hypothetical protein